MTKVSMEGTNQMTYYTNQMAQAQAEINRAQGQAAAQKLIQTSITKDILTMEYLKKWNGVLPTVMPGNGSMLFNLNTH